MSSFASILSQGGASASSKSSSKPSSKSSSKSRKPKPSDNNITITQFLQPLSKPSSKAHATPSKIITKNGVINVNNNVNNVNNNNINKSSNSNQRRGLKPKPTTAPPLIPPPSFISSNTLIGPKPLKPPSSTLNPSTPSFTPNSTPINLTSLKKKILKSRNSTYIDSLKELEGIRLLEGETSKVEICNWYTEVDLEDEDVVEEVEDDVEGFLRNGESGEIVSMNVFEVKNFKG